MFLFVGLFVCLCVMFTSRVSFPAFLPSKFFFSSGLSTDYGEDVSARGIRARIQKLVAEEDTKKPLTDQAIVDILKKEGVQIARRTVAKYRDQLGILSARMRKRV